MAKKKRTTTTGPSPLTFRDRVKELRRVRAADLVGAPWNWREHPENQQAALAGSIEECGYTDPVLAWEMPDGSLCLFDGHLRKDLINSRVGPDTLIPVIVTDLSEADAQKANLTHDPIAAMARANADKVEALLREVSTDNEALSSLIDGLAKKCGAIGGGDPDDPGLPPPVAMQYRVMVECTDEKHQAELLAKFEADGIVCKPLIL